MAHACVLLGDLGRAQAARDYGLAVLLLAQEAEAYEAIAWSVQAKTARWTGGFVEEAEFARRGFEVSGPTGKFGWLCAGQFTAERVKTRMAAAVARVAQPARTSRLRAAPVVVLVVPQMLCRPAPAGSSTP
jgi:hypothetical protein